MLLARLSLAFSHFLCYPQANWALLILIHRWVGLCTFWDPGGLSNKLSCEAGNFSCCCNRYRFLQPEFLRLYFPMLGPWIVWSISLPSCSSQFICTQMWDCPVLQLPPCRESSLPGCQSPSLLPIWMNVSSLTPLLSDFHTVQFSVSFGCFLFLNLLLSFFWLCKEAQCVYLHSILAGRTAMFLCMYTIYHIWFIHSFLNEHLSCFYL